MVQFAPLILMSLAKTIPGRLLDSFFPASQFSIWKTRTNFLLQLERDQTDGSPFILSLALKTWPRSFVDCSNQLGSLKVLFVCFNCRDCPKKCCITWFIFDSFCHNLCTLSFLTKLCPHWTLSVVLLRTSSSGLAVPADFHPVAIAVYLLSYSYLIWEHGNSLLGVVRH